VRGMPEIVRVLTRIEVALYALRGDPTNAGVLASTSSSGRASRP